MTKILSQGAKALATGNALEGQIKTLFTSKGYPLEKWTQQREAYLVDILTALKRR